MSRTRPLIGITCQYDPGASDRGPSEMNGVHRLAETYAGSIREAGGLPLLLPTTPEDAIGAAYIEAVDGLVLAGGGDLDPHDFGEEPQPGLGPVDPLRDAFELVLCREALARNMPMLAVCKGAQLVNVVAGGTVLQDIASVLAEPLQHHQHAPVWYGSHRIEIEPDSLLASVMNVTETRVNSFHHQSIGDVAPGFRACARTSDGVIEAVESVQHAFVIGVQFHPEAMTKVSRPIAALFHAFIEAARVASQAL